MQVSCIEALSYTLGSITGFEMGQRQVPFVDFQPRRIFK